ncbi:DUF504 domain-containing protein [Candidatus Woesearchaeota archaeon]|nr:DUF504 domain-containing protein [Candidatus Woesearchaeota archaeon]
MVLREQDRHFLWSLFSATGLILFWRGIWESSAAFPYMEAPFFSLFIGTTMLVLSGLIFREFDPLGGLDKAVNKVLMAVHNHPQKHLFHIKYHDKVTKQDFAVEASRLKAVEKDHLVFEDANGKEFFIPAHRITEIMYQGQTHWRY